MWPRVLLALFVAYVAATAIHIGYVVAHEPFSFDAWNVTFATRGEPASVGRFFDFWWQEYQHSNPRLGQAFAYAGYKVVGFAEIATPLAYLAISLAVTVLALGRWPWRRTSDLALWAIAIGFGWFAFPELGRNMFCRAYSANYVYGAAIQLWFLVPLRLAASYDLPRGKVIAYVIAGFVAGICNEHTGPTLAAGLLGYALWLRRRARPASLVWAGGLGVLAGFLALFFAPGQAERYGGVGSEIGIVTRVFQRGVIKNLEIVSDYLTAAAPLLCLVAVLLAIAQLRSPNGRDPRGAVRLVVIALAAGLVLAMTLFASPKLGSRFYLFGMALLLAASIAVVDAVLERTRHRAILVVLAVASSIYAAAFTVPLYRRASRDSDARMAALAAAPRGSVLVADAFTQVEESWWFIGDDFRVAEKRELVAHYRGLARVYFRGYEADAPLGTSAIRIVPRYWIAGEACATEDEGFDLDGIKAFDVPGMQAAIRNFVELAQRRIAPRRLARYEVAVELVGGPPPGLPRPQLVLARWEAGRLDGFTAKIARPGVSTAREVRPSPALRERGLDLHVLQIGTESRRLDGSLRYTPWRTGVYWILGCDATECWIVAAARNHAL